MSNNTFHEVVNSENAKHTKNLGTMRGPRTVRKPDDHQQQQQSSASSSSSALVRRTEQQRKKIGITSTKAKGFTAQQQQQSSSTATLEDPKKKNRLNFDEGDGDQPVINNHVHQQHQNNDQTFVNVTTCTEGVVEYSISPSVSPTRPKRKAAQAAALLFQQQRKPKRRAQLDKENGVPPVPSPPHNRLDNEPTRSATPPTTTATVEEGSNNNNTLKTGKQLRQQRKNNNRKVNPRTLISVDSNVPAKVQPILVDDRQKYSVQAVLAVFTLPVPIGCARLPQKGFFIKWRGYDGQDSWVLSADAFCLEMACSFSEKTGMDAAFDAMLGNELPLHFINELQKSSKFERVKALYQVPELRQSGLDIAWADGATQQEKRKAVSLLPAFVKIMNDCPVSTLSDEDEE